MGLHTSRLSLKKLSNTDQEDAIKILTNNIVKQTYMLPDFQNSAEAVALFQRLRDYSAAEEHYIRGVYLHGKLIGFFNDVEICGDTIELGWALHPDYHNCGYATEALKFVIADLSRLGFQTVNAGAFAENAASIRVMEKAGMHRLSREEEIEYRGKTHRCIYYST